MARRKAFRIRGQLPELAGVPLRVRRRALPEIVQVAVRHTRIVAPKRRGLSSPKSIASRIVGQVEVEGLRGLVQAKAPHSHLIELGVSPHPLRGKRKRKGRVMKIFGDENILRRGADHPGFAARPFMQKGLDASRKDVEQVLYEEALTQFSTGLRNVEDLIGGVIS